MCHTGSWVSVSEPPWLRAAGAQWLGWGPNGSSGCTLFSLVLVPLGAVEELAEWAQAKGPDVTRYQLCGWRHLGDSGSHPDSTLQGGEDLTPGCAGSGGGGESDAPAH